MTKHEIKTVRGDFKGGMIPMKTDTLLVIAILLVGFWAISELEETPMSFKSPCDGLYHAGTSWEVSGTTIVVPVMKWYICETKEE